MVELTRRASLRWRAPSAPNRLNLIARVGVGPSIDQSDTNTTRHLSYKCSNMDLLACKGPHLEPCDRGVDSKSIAEVSCSFRFEIVELPTRKSHRQEIAPDASVHRFIGERAAYSNVERCDRGVDSKSIAEVSCSFIFQLVVLRIDRSRDRVRQFDDREYA